MFLVVVPSLHVSVSREGTLSHLVSPTTSSLESPLFSHKPFLYPYLFFSCFFSPFWQTKVVSSFPGSLGAPGHQVQASRNLWTPHRYFTLLLESHGVPEGLLFPRTLLRVRTPLSSPIPQTYLGFLVPYQEVSGVLPWQEEE